MRKPTISKGVAARYAGPRENIYEVSFGNGIGGLISVRTLDDGTPVVELYRLDAEIDVRTSRDEVAK